MENFVEPMKNSQPRESLNKYMSKHNVQCIIVHIHVYTYTLPSYIERKPLVGDEIVVNIGPFESDIVCTSVHQEHDTLKNTTVFENQR